MTVVVVSGTPGTGKTTLARLVQKLGYRRIDVKRLISKKRMSAGYDKKRKCEIIDTDKLVKALAGIITESKNKNLVVDSHLAHYLPPDYVGLCIVTKCELKELKKRLGKRYNPDKVRENLDAEIFDVCFNEAVEFGHRVAVVDTTKGVLLSQIERLLRTK